jgi:hypothetical protein
MLAVNTALTTKGNNKYSRPDEENTLIEITELILTLLNLLLPQIRLSTCN